SSPLCTPIPAPAAVHVKSIASSGKRPFAYCRVSLGWGRKDATRQDDCDHEDCHGGPTSEKKATYRLAIVALAAGSTHRPACPFVRFFGRALAGMAHCPGEFRIQRMVRRTQFV